MIRLFGSSIGGWTGLGVWTGVGVGLAWVTLVSTFSSALGSIINYGNKCIKTIIIFLIFY